jgi:hypothetical protein
VGQVSTTSKRDFASEVRRPPASDDTGREAVMLSIKQALVTSRLTLAGSDAGADPYNARQRKNPHLEWARRRRF